MLSVRMMSGPSAAALLVVGVVAAFGARPAWPQEASSISEGASVYGDMCGSCHNARSPLERTDRDWVTIINHMRVRGNLTGREVKSVLAFLQATNQDPRQTVALPPAPFVPDDGDADESDAILRGKWLVEQKACLGCHVIGTEGGNIGPNLNGVVQAKGEAYVVDKLADPTFDRETSMMPNFGLSDEEISRIVAYMHSLNGRND